MILQDNIIKEFLKNVYFITGTPCGGKTTISRELAKDIIYWFTILTKDLMIIDGLQMHCISRQ